MRAYSIEENEEMKNLIGLLMLLLLSNGLSSCTEKKQNTNIIATKPKPVQKKETQSMGDYHQSMPVEWLGTNYVVEVSRQSDKALPLADDGMGNKYYDNQITLKILRHDHSEFFNRTFSKADFVSYVDEAYRKNSALLGIVFDKAEGNYIQFAVSVGSPDKMSDEYVPLVMKVSNLGAITIHKDTQLDTRNTRLDDTDSDQEEEDDI